MSEDLSPEEVAAEAVVQWVYGNACASGMPSVDRFILAALEAAGYSVVKLEAVGAFDVLSDNHILSTVEDEGVKVCACGDDWPCRWSEQVTVLYEDEDRPPDAVPLYRVLSGQVVEAKR